jgi:hypothetical protein
MCAGAGRPQLHRGSSAHLKVSGGQDTYTEEEKRVLLQTSHINRKEYVPFMSVDLAERFQYSLPFTDRDGHLALSPKQRRDFVRWSRPDEIYPEPKMVIGQHVDCFSIKQTVRHRTETQYQILIIGVCILSRVRQSNIRTPPYATNISACFRHCDYGFCPLISDSADPLIY